MKQKYQLILSILLLFFNYWNQTEAQGTESFTHSSSSSSYVTINWTGTNGLAWSATDARGDQTITPGNKAILVRTGSITGALTAGQQSAGVGKISFDYKIPFSDATKNITATITAGSKVIEHNIGLLTVNQIYNTGEIEINSTDATNIIITISSVASGARLVVDNLVWTSATPSITVMPSSLSGFTYGEGNGPSSEQSFTVSGAALTGDLTLTPSTNYEISTGTGGSFSATNLITLTPSSGTVANTPIYVRLKAGLTQGTYNGESITAASTGADNKNVSCDGSVSAPPAQIDWANLQWPGSGTINFSDPYNVYARVYEPGVTDAVGQGAGISAWIGYSTTNTDPSTWTDWVSATYNGDDGANNDEYVADLGAAVPTYGTYYYASRFKLGEAAYVYGGFNAGFWGGGNVSGVLTVNAPPQLDWANLQHPASGTITLGGEFIVYGQVYEPGVTNAAGQGANISAWIGYNTDDTDPSTWTNWVAATYLGDVGNNDEYKADIGAVISPAGTYYYATRFKYGLADYVYGGYSLAGGGFWEAGVNVNGILTIQTPEPSAQATTFSASSIPPTATAITLTWTDASPASEHYLIKGSATSFGGIVAPVDGTAEADALLVKNVDAGVQTAVFTGLTPETTYYFKIYPYNGTGALVNYKTDGSIPEASATTLAVTVGTYTWVGLDNASWSTATNWSPTRTSPATTDIMQFSAGTTRTVTGVANETIGKLIVSNNSVITLQASAATQTLTIAGGSGDDLSLTAGSQLNVSGGNALTIALATGATGSISGAMTFAGGAHKLTAADASGLSFESGAIFTTGTSFSGNAYGNVTAGSVIFKSGSIYVHTSGSNPFATTPPITIFQTGSRYKQATNGSPSLSGRTYADLEIDAATFNQATMTGGNPLILDNLIITNCLVANFNLTGGITINGNIQVLNGSVGFSPASASNINLSGSSIQTISGSGTLSFGANAIINVNNDVVVDKNATISGALNIASGKTLTLNPTRQLTVSGALTNSAGSAGLVIKSDATGTGSLIHNTADVPATVERYITGNSNLTAYDYHLVSVPLDAAVTNAQFLGSYLYHFDAATQAWTSNGTSTTAPVPVDAGYMVYYPNASTTYNFVGELNNGSFTAATGLDAADEFALVPNPYPSAIDWDAASGWTKTNLRDAIYVWDPVGNQYAAYGAEAGINGGTRYIPAGQAFFVKSSAASTVLSMNNSVRVHNTQAFWKEGEVTKDLLRVKALGNGLSDELVLRFAQGVEAGLDAKDVDKLFGSDEAPQIYTLTADERQLSINTQPYSQQTVVVPMGFELKKDGEVNLNFSGIEAFEPTVNIFLEDSFTGQMINLRENPVYTFNHTQGNEPQRFKLHLMGVTAVGETPSALARQIWSDGEALYLSFPELQGQKAVYELFDLSGRLLESRSLSLGAAQRVQPQASGVVIARVSIANQVYVNKLFIR